MAGIYIYCENAGTAAELVGFAQKSGKSANIIVFDEKTAAEVAGSGAQVELKLKMRRKRYSNQFKEYLR